MKLSKTAAHATLALAYLAMQDSQSPVQARQVAEHLKIPTDSALKILQTLARKRLLQSQLGRAGGYRLRKIPDSITLLQIVEAIDGPLQGAVPLTGDYDGLTESIELLEAACERANLSLRDQLDAVSLASLINMHVAN